MNKERIENAILRIRLANNEATNICKYYEFVKDMPIIKEEIYRIFDILQLDNLIELLEDLGGSNE